MPQIVHFCTLCAHFVTFFCPIKFSPPPSPPPQKKIVLLMLVLPLHSLDSHSLFHIKVSSSQFRNYHITLRISVPFLVNENRTHILFSIHSKLHLQLVSYCNFFWFMLYSQQRSLNFTVFVSITNAWVQSIKITENKMFPSLLQLQYL